jgi:hypothetical protein
VLVGRACLHGVHDLHVPGSPPPLHLCSCTCTKLSVPSNLCYCFATPASLYGSRNVSKHASSHLPLLARGWGCDAALTAMGEARHRPLLQPGPSLPLPPACLFALFARPKPFGTAYWCCVRLFVCYLQSLFEEFTRRALSLLADHVTSLSPAIETCYYVSISAFTSLQER